MIVNVFVEGCEREMALILFQLYRISSAAIQRKMVDQRERRSTGGYCRKPREKCRGVAESRSIPREKRAE